MAVKSLQQRFVYKMLAQVMGSGASFLIQILATRALGPLIFGQFVFLSDLFTRFWMFLDLGAPQALFIKTSKNPKNMNYVYIFWFFTLFLLCFSVLTLTLLYELNLFPLLFQNSETSSIFLAFTYVFLLWMLNVLDRLIDAYGLSVQGSLLLSGIKFLNVLIIIYLLFFNQINLNSFFLSQNILFFLSFFFYALVFYRYGYKCFHIFSIQWKQTYTILKEYYIFIGPSFLILLFFSLDGFLDIWLLNHFCGNTENAYFGFSFRLMTLSILFMRAIWPLFTREISQAIFFQDSEKTKSYVQRGFMAFLIIALAINSYLFFFAPEIIILSAGKSFLASQRVLQILCFWGLFEMLSNIAVGIFQAQEDLKIYRNISVSLNILGPLAAYYFITNPLVGGAQGLALKMLFFYSLRVILFFYFLKIKLNWGEILKQSIFTLLYFFSITYFIYILTPVKTPLLRLCFSSVFYMFAILFFLSKSFTFVGFDIKEFLFRKTDS